VAGIAVEFQPAKRQPLAAKRQVHSSVRHYYCSIEEARFELKQMLNPSPISIKIQYFSLVF